MQEAIFIKHSCRMNRKLELVAEKFFWLSVAGYYCPIQQSLESKPSRIVIFLSRCFLFSRDVYWELPSKHLISLETRSYWQGDEWLFIFFEEARSFLLETPEEFFFIEIYFFLINDKTMQEVIFIKHSCRMNRKLELVAKNFLNECGWVLLSYSATIRVQTLSYSNFS